MKMRQFANLKRRAARVSEQGLEDLGDDSTASGRVDVPNDAAKEQAAGGRQSPPQPGSIRFPAVR